MFEKIYTQDELKRINDARTAIPGHRYIDTWGNIYVGTSARKINSLAGTSATWGNITGDIVDQTDLVTLVATKQDLLVSGVNIKTINGISLLGSGDISIVGGVQSVTGLNTDNTDPLNPIIQISVDGVTISGDGTPGNPLVSIGTGTVMSVTDDGNGVVSVDNTDPTNPIILFNGINITGARVSGDGTSGNPLTVDFSGILTDTLADGKILIGNASNVATAVTPSGDATISNTGAITLADEFQLAVISSFRFLTNN